MCNVVAQKCATLNS